MNTAYDDEGEPILRSEDVEMFQYGRAGDHLITPFQCDRCHYQNINWVDQNEYEPREELMRVATRRANLDALWSRKSGTVASNMRRARALEEAGVNEAGYKQVNGPLGPYPLKDVFGMKPAVAMLLKSMSKGINAATLQYSTMRMYKSAFHNVYHAGVSHLGMTMLGKETRKLYVTDCPADSRWYDKVLHGAHTRMGDQVKQDLALSVEVVHELHAWLDSDWQAATTDEERVEIAEMAMLTVVCFCAGMRGEEMFLMHAPSTRKVNQHARGRERNVHACLGLIGARKRLAGTRCFLIPMVVETETGLKPGLWIDRMLAALAGVGRAETWVFQHRSKPEKKPQLRDYTPLFVNYLERIQLSRPDLIHKDLDVGDAFGLARSARRGSTTHARNQGVSEADVETNQLWRKTYLNVGTANLGRMLHHYTEMSQSLKILLRYSRQL